MSLVGVCVQVLDSEMTNQDAGAKIDGVDVSQVRVCHAVFYPDPQQPMPYRLKAAFPSLSPFSIATAEFLSTSVPRKFSTPTENRPIYTALPWGSSAAFRRRTCLIAAAAAWVGIQHTTHSCVEIKKTRQRTKIKVVGCIVEIDDASTNTEYTIEDTTGRLKVGGLWGCCCLLCLACVRRLKARESFL